jgi:hypothetical protein
VGVCDGVLLGYVLCGLYIRFVLIPLSRGGELFSFSYLLSFFISGSGSGLWAGWGWLVMVVVVVDHGDGGGILGLRACLLACSLARSLPCSN